MNVKSILDEKGRDVFTVEPGTKLSDAATILAKNKIGAVVATKNGGEIAGILSERDIVRAICQEGADVLDRDVGSVMTSAVKVCGENHTVNQLMEIMTEGRFRHLPVETDGKLAGLISIGDVVRKRIEEVEREAEEIKAYIAS